MIFMIFVIWTGLRYPRSCDVTRCHTHICAALYPYVDSPPHNEVATRGNEQRLSKVISSLPSRSLTAPLA